jgi:hypothetical protein
MERVLMLAIAAAAWPLWGPFLKRVIAEIRAAAELEPPPEGPKLRVSERHTQYVNSAWDDMHLGRRGHTHVERRAGDGFVHRG